MDRRDLDALGLLKHLLYLMDLFFRLDLLIRRVREGHYDLMILLDHQDRAVHQRQHHQGNRKDLSRL